ncbi:MAG: hypothetical protein OXF28_01420 [Thaumarchaeota archaeon]|nr:hypothetical protein [Nitrososphaerota archaeon]
MKNIFKREKNKLIIYKTTTNIKLNELDKLQNEIKKKSNKLRTISEKLVAVEAEYDKTVNKLMVCKKELRIKMLEYNEI